MQLPAERWFEAIFIRKSRRVFISRIPEKEKIAQIEKTCQEFRPFRAARAEFIKEPPEDVFKGILRGYGKIRGAPFYAAFIGEMDDPHVQEAVGYTGEGIILEMTALGLDTCWVGGYFRPEAVSRHLSLSQNEKVLAVTPVGYAEDGYAFSEKIMSGFVNSRRRRPLSEMVQGGVPANWAEKALEAARQAPSAVNRQPWLFAVTSNAITISSDSRKSYSNISKRLDCGIAMLHLELGALASGVKGRWEFLATPQVAKLVFLE